ncbi:type IV secretory system conjugative DNA transfer family protein [Acanthopleuribacter pedis]|uniref:Type IV secretion system DNA-binding domain-containing protein n=1 Tax=Acanthopleuribacter pedis TaxID=442870 RepID=A0A8J7U5P7_9BACT|nr:type IV secretion system DNA-binding domain-containing protein [Acanthopleuribacter pedis]MBO1319536.1 type IV secretion system DNA-binding domain-containing protein [Acanthopleuribacter pedis]
MSQYFRSSSVQNALGKTVAFPEQSPEVVLRKQDRTNHTHIIGSTGTGKSKFLELMMRQDMRNRQAGFCLLDPHGSLYEEVLLYASHKNAHLADRFVCFDPAQEADHIVGFNPIPPNAKQNMDYILDMLISACLKAWGQDNTDKTPRITKWLENIFYTIIVNDLTLVETAPLLSISKRSIPQRQRLLKQVTNDVILDDWDMFHTSTNTQKQMLIEGAANRLRKFLRNEAIRNVIGQKVHTLDLGKIMAEGKILLVNLNGRERISYENTKLLGIMLVNEFFRVAKLRNPHDRHIKPFYLYVDEFANFITRDIARALEECRKFQLFLILAHQHLAQLKEDDEYLFASVLTNCKNKVVFGGLSKYDAQIMTDELSTGFVNLKKIKDQTFSTKVRHVEETRVVRGTSTGTSVAESSSIARGTSQSTGHSRSTTRTEGTTASSSSGGSVTTGSTMSQGTTTTEGTTLGTSSSVGQTEGQSWGESTSTTTGTTTTEGQSLAEGESRSRTEGISTSRSQSHSEGGSRSTSEQRSQSHGRSQQTGTSHSSSSGKTRNATVDGVTSRSRSQGSSFSQNKGSGTSESSSVSQGSSQGSTWNSSQSQGETQSRSDAQGSSHTKTQSRSASQSQSSSTSSQQGRSQSTSTTETESESRSSSESHSESSSQSESESQNWSESTGTSRSTSEGTSTTETMGTSQTSTEGSTRTTSTGESRSTVPFLKPVEYQELSSRTFWSKDELLYMELAAMKNQETGQAFIKIGKQAPVQTQIEFVRPVVFSERTSPRRLAAFQEKLSTANADYYTPVTEVRQEYEQRQTEFFGEPLRFDEKPLLLEKGEDVKTLSDGEGLFNE